MEKEFGGANGIPAPDSAASESQSWD